eukprot:TRINITY_DN4181_c0_g1_i1.p1 TRINITY_DN4181_c0_g1~~TRINITY_DN4181_c0_g1_i1.p1  ORF type:complete len:342 (-),score=85.30 TRINITY_DN4181_c0_g1_i1:188-1213(-)
MSSGKIFGGGYARVSSPPALSPAAAVRVEDEPVQTDASFEMKAVSPDSLRQRQGFSRADGAGGDPIVRMLNVHKTYLLGVEGVAALRGVSLTINRGEFVVILGKSGSGKTSMLNILGTIDRPTKGDLYLCGKRISNNTSDEDLSELRLHKLGFVFQTFNLIASMSALENVELPMVLAGTRTAAEIRERAMQLLKKVRMDERHEHKPTQLSGGEQQRTTIARAISNTPDLLLLDEPTGDLDTKNSHRVLKMLLDLNANEGITMVMVTHDVGLKVHANRVIHMLDGKIHRIETVPEEKRYEAYRLLEEKIAADNLSESNDLEKSALSTETRTPYKDHHWIKRA